MSKKYQSILIAVDGSTQAEVAFEKAIQVAKRNNAMLYITHVIDMRAFESLSSFDETLAAEASKTADNTLVSYKEKALKQGLTDVETIVMFGIPKKVIANDLPKKYPIDLIMMGATGLNSFERLLIGSVSIYVTRHAPCDVLIVRTKAKKTSE